MPVNESCLAGLLESYLLKLTRNGGFVVMKKFVKVMKALSDPNRVKILKMLQYKNMCVCEMQEALGVAQPTVSKHLRILEEAGFVEYEKDGLWVNYLLAKDSDTPYVKSLLENMRGWLENEPEIIRLKERLPMIRREDICNR